jgi:hypothetical protein
VSIKTALQELETAVEGTVFDDISPLTTKGDILVHTGSANVRQGIGTDGHVLTADSAQTNGLKWAAASSITALDVVTIDNTDSPYTVLSSDQVILCDCSSGAITVNLPASASNDGRLITIKKIDTSLANAVTIEGNLSETIDGELNTTLNTQYEKLEIVSDGSNWVITDRYIPMSLGSLTTTGAFTTNSTYTSYYERDGYYLIGKVKIAFAGAPNSVGCTLNLPSSLSADTAKMVFNTDGNSAYLVGTGSARDSGVNSYFLFPRMGSGTPTVVNVFAQEVNVINNSVLNSGFSQSYPFTIASGDSAEITYRVPISGWKG